MGFSVFGELQNVSKIFNLKPSTKKTLSLIVLFFVIGFFVVKYMVFPVWETKKNIDGLISNQAKIEKNIDKLTKVIDIKLDKKLDKMYDDFIFVAKHQSEMSRDAIIDYLEKSKNKEVKLSPHKTIYDSNDNKYDSIPLMVLKQK